MVICVLELMVLRKEVEALGPAPVTTGGVVGAGVGAQTGSTAPHTPAAGV